MFQPRRDKKRAIKRVRGRDGSRCVVCQIDEQTHTKRYGRTLDVHRNEPGSDYSTEPGMCTTLCEVCHDALHGKRHWGWIKMHDLDYEERRAAGFGSPPAKTCMRRRTGGGMRLGAHG